MVVDFNLVKAMNSNTAERYSSSLLFMFDSIVDIDLNMILFLKKNYQSSSYLDPDIIKNNDLNFFKAILIKREDKNPISLIIRDQFANSAANLYYEIITEKYKDILYLDTPLLAFGILLCNINKAGEFHPTVVCKNEHEIQYIKALVPNVKTISEEKVNLDHYDSIYVKDFADCIRFDKYESKLKGKNIYILNYDFNLEQGERGILKFEIFEKIPQSNKLSLVDPYTNFKMPIY